MLAVVVLAAGVLVWLNVQKQSGQDHVSYAPQVVYTGEDFVMDTYVTQRVSGENGEKAVEEVSAMLMETEQTFSRFRSDSVISKVNAQAGIGRFKGGPFLFLPVGRAFSDHHCPPGGPLGDHDRFSQGPGGG